MQRTASIILGSAAAGLLLGPAFDLIHVVTGALSYDHPWFLDQAWWVAPEFAIAFAVIAAGLLGLEERFGDERRAAARSGAGWTAWRNVAFIVAYVLTGLWYEHPLAVTAVLGAALVARVLLEQPDRLMVASSLLLALGGTAWESLLSSFDGTFDYAVVDLGQVPSWLPLLYLHAGPASVMTIRMLWRTPTSTHA